MHSPDLHFIAVQVGFVLRDRGPMVRPRVVAMLRARGLLDADAEAVIRFGLKSGVLSADPADPELLCARRA